MTFFDIFENTVIHSFIPPFAIHASTGFPRIVAGALCLLVEIFFLHYLIIMVEKITLYLNQIHTISIALLTKQQQKTDGRERKKRPNTRIFSSSSRVPVFQLFFFLALSPSFLTHNSGLIIIKTHCVFCVCVE